MPHRTFLGSIELLVMTYRPRFRKSLKRDEAQHRRRVRLSDDRNRRK